MLNLSHTANKDTWEEFVVERVDSTRAGDIEKGETVRIKSLEQTRQKGHDMYLSAEADFYPWNTVLARVERSQMPGDRVDRRVRMATLTSLIGVNCTYCHVNDKWDSEEKQAKQAARKMFRMIGSTNGDFLGDRISSHAQICPVQLLFRTKILFPHLSLL